MAILRGLQERGTGVPDPTSYIKAAVQRANGLRVALPAQPQQEDFMEDGEGQEDGEQEDDEDGEIEDFEEPEAEGEEMDEIGAEEGEAEAGADGYDEAEAGVAEDEYGAEDVPPEDEAGDAAYDAGDAGMDYEVEVPAVATKSKAKSGERRVVGGLTGYTKLFPTRPAYAGQASTGAVKSEIVEDADAKPEQTPIEKSPMQYSSLPLTPQEKLVQIHDLSVKNGLNLDQVCIKALSRLPFHRAKDLIDDVLLGGKDRKGVNNPSRYLTIGVEKMQVALGVEQGIAMELAVSLGVVLNNEALDELACIPRKEAHSIIRELSRNASARTDPIQFIQAEVMKCRASMDARPFPGTR